MRNAGQQTTSTFQIVLVQKHLIEKTFRLEFFKRIYNVISDSGYKHFNMKSLSFFISLNVFLNDTMCIYFAMEESYECQ